VSGLAASRIFIIRPLFAEILHIVWLGILLWATLYICNRDVPYCCLVLVPHLAKMLTYLTKTLQ